MSRIENSARVCSIGSSSNEGNGESSSAATTTTTTASTSQFHSLVGKYRMNTNNSSSSIEKRYNYMIQSRRDHLNGIRCQDGNQNTESEQSSSHSVRRRRDEVPPLEIMSSSSATVDDDDDSGEEERVGRFACINSPHYVKHLENSIGNVHISDCDRVESEDTTATTSSREAESASIDEVFDAIGTSVNNDESCEQSSSSSSASSTSLHSPVDGVQLSSQNLKPILKRKLEKFSTSPASTPTSLPPPILKKRDSIGEVVSSLVQPSVNTVNDVNQSKPLSILKNRQPRGSYSFDDNLTSVEAASAEDSQYQLKPILKKKSWSTENENVLSFSSQINDNVKSILKSTDKSLSSSAASSHKNSLIIDEPVSLYCSLPCSEVIGNQPPPPPPPKGILKTSGKNRSTSLSPCTSTDSLDVDDSESDSVSLTTPKQPRKSAFRKKSSLDDGIEIGVAPSSSSSSPPPSAVPLFGNPVYHHDFDTVNIENNSVDNQWRQPLDDSTTTTTSITSFATNATSSAASNLRSILKNNSVDSDTNTEEEVSSENCSPSEPRMDSLSPTTTTTVLLRKNRNTPGESRPKSCFVLGGDGEPRLSTTTSTTAASSLLRGVAQHTPIAERLSLLKQNGEENWKSRYQRFEAEKEILEPGVVLRNKEPKGSIIANRLSSLFESQNQWRNRHSTNNVQLNQLLSTVEMSSAKSKPDEKKILRDTPKRIGLRGCTLNERALSSVSSKLNSVLTANKSPFGGVPVKKKPDPIVLDRSNELEKSSSAPIESYVLKPDDEETFGSFYDFHTEDILAKKLPPIDSGYTGELLSLDSLQPDTSLLLSHRKQRRIPAPKRRQATTRNPLAAIVNTESKVETSPSVPAAPPPPQSPSKVAELSSKSSYAITALAGLASTEDFKSVANKLRTPSSPLNTPNDLWRTHDLKNSFQSRMLILVKGRPRAQLRLVEPVWKSLNTTDSFILATKETVYAYVGQHSNIIERTKCIEVADLIRKRKDLCYRSLSNPLVLVDAHSDSTRLNLFDKLRPILSELDYTEEQKLQFDKLFKETPLDDDEYYEEAIICTNMIYQVMVADNDAHILAPVEKYWARSPRYELLQADSAFVFDYGSEMYVWIGKNVSNLLRKKAVDMAKDLWLKGYDYSELDISPFGTNHALKLDKRPEWAWFTRVNQNMEPLLLKDKFANWPAFTLTRSVKSRSRSSSLKSTENKTPVHTVVKKDLSAELNLFPVDAKVDMIAKLPKPQNMILEQVSLGRGAGDVIKDEDGLSVKIVSLEIQCFVIDDVGNRIELTGSDRNFMFTSESYYIRWKYRLTRISRNLKTGGESKYSEQHGGRDRLCYFVWQGKDARNTQRGATALNAIDKLREEGAFQVFMEFGNEEPAFLRIFNGSLVIEQGKRGTVAEIVHYRMFSLKDTLAEEAFLLEQDCCIKNLRSRQSFIFLNPQVSKLVYIWHGCKSQPAKRKLIRKFLEESLLKDRSKEFGFNDSIGEFEIVEIEEGNESSGFLNIFSPVNSPSDSLPKRSSKSNLHREIYFSLIDDNKTYDFTPRLFQFIPSTENLFEAIEITPAYLPPVEANITVCYPFKQEDLYERAKNRPTFFMFDNHYEVYLWESKFPFFLPTINSKPKQSESADRNGPKMIDIESEIKSESNTTAGFIPQLWHAERKCALETTLSYCHAKNRSEPPTAYVICAGLEPDSFCGLFPTWTYYDNVAQIHIEDGRKPCQQILVQEILAEIRDINTSTYSYEVLKRRPLLEGINVLCLESYLDDAEFEQIFAMNREEFYALPTWKQKIIKQEKELF